MASVDKNHAFRLQLSGIRVVDLSVLTVVAVLGALATIRAITTLTAFFYAYDPPTHQEGKKAPQNQDQSPGSVLLFQLDPEQAGHFRFAF